MGALTPLEARCMAEPTWAADRIVALEEALQECIADFDAEETNRMDQCARRARCALQAAPEEGKP